ncbi:hypothetical protein LguiA_019909 [Lonicera macranthoides]
MVISFTTPLAKKPTGSAKKIELNEDNKKPKSSKNEAAKPKRSAPQRYTILAFAELELVHSGPWPVFIFNYSPEQLEGEKAGDKAIEEENDENKIDSHGEEKVDDSKIEDESLELEKWSKRVPCTVMLSSLQWFKVRMDMVKLEPGLCKSKSEKSGRIPSGDYEYVDINVNGTRYIIEIFLATEFELATSLVELIPNIFVGKIEELKQVVR